MLNNQEHMAENLGQSPPPNKVPLGRRLILVFCLTAWAALITYFWAVGTVRCCVSTQGEGSWGAALGYFVITALAGLTGLFIGTFIITRLKNWPSMVRISIILGLVYPVVLGAILGINAWGQYRVIKKSQQEKKIGQTATVITECRDMIQKNYWDNCVARTLKTQSDYNECLRQVQDRGYVYNKQTCDGNYAEIQASQAQSMSDCTDIKANGPWYDCAKKYLVDETTYQQCLNQADNEYRKDICQNLYSKIGHNPL